MDEIIKNCLELDLEPGQVEAIAKLTTDEKAKQGIHGAMKVINAFKDHLTPNHVNQMASIAGLKKPNGDDPPPPKPEDDDSASGSSDDDEGDDDSDDDEEDASKGADADDGDDDDGEPDGKGGKSGKTKSTKKRGTMKDIPPAVQAQLDSIRKQAEADRKEKVELQKALKQERDARELRDCVELAKRELPNLGDSAQLGAVIKRLQDQGAWKELEQFLKGANAKAASAALFSERGAASAPDAGTGADRLNQATQDLMKRDSKLTIAKAMDLAIQQDPSLYDEYRKEHQRRAREGV